MAPVNEQTVEGRWRDGLSHFRNDRLLVSVRSGWRITQTLDSVRRSLERELGPVEILRRRGRKWAVLKFSPLADAAERIPALAGRLAALRDLSYAEPDFAGSDHLTPDDPRYAEQVWPQQIAIEALWAGTVGHDDVLLAVLDSGICMNGWSDLGHEDLDTPRFITRHVSGVLFNHDYVGNIFSTGPPRDGRGHGTHVTGIAAATGNNYRGIAGANWKSPVYIARVVDDAGGWFVSDVKLAVDDLMSFVWGPFAFFDIWTARHLVINLSLGCQTYSDALRQMCDDTDNGRTMLCVAAKSRGISPNRIDFPADFASTFKHVIAVGSVDKDDVINLPILGNYSAITLFAPGVDILSTIPRYPTTLFAGPGVHAYETISGTSQACPVVAGAVSLLWSWNRRLRPADIREGLIKIAKQIPGPGGNYPRLHLQRFREIRRSWSPFPWWW